MNYNIKRECHLLLILIIPFIVGAVLYPHMPEQVPIHWNIYGEVDGYGSKLFGTFGLPVLNVGMYILFLYFQRLTPNVKIIRNLIMHIWLSDMLCIFFLFLFALTIAAAFEYQINIGKWITIAAAIMVIIMGFNMRNVRHNYFIGFKYPWTLASEEVISKTLRLEYLYV